MFLNASSPATNTLHEELSGLGVAFPGQALQQIIEAVTVVITPRVSSSVERQIEARVRAEFAADVTVEASKRVTTEVTSSLTAEVSAKLQASFDACVKAAVQEQLLAVYGEIRLQRHRMFGWRTDTGIGLLGLFNEVEVLAQEATAATLQMVKTHEGALRETI
jgi:hypothetical protein